MNESQPSPINSKKAQGENTSPTRRGFLKTIGAVAASAVTFGVGTHQVNKYAIEERKLNDLFARFNGQEKSFLAASDAANLLIGEMEMENTATVNISGTSHPNNRIEILRNFLTQHLQTRGIGERYYDVQKSILSRGVYDKYSLIKLAEQAQHLHTLKDEMQNESRTRPLYRSEPPIV
jgi:hypothetical protein